ncbi:MAG: alpha/beta hydrolase family protein [Halobacteriota archaeon]
MVVWDRLEALRPSLLGTSVNFLTRGYQAAKCFDFLASLKPLTAYVPHQAGKKIVTKMPEHKSEEVMWDVDGIAVYGTVTRPADDGLHPAIVFVAGSGPTDRDWCSPLLLGTNGSARLLANALTEKGFVTLRYDKRAAGPHVRENLPRLVGKISMQAHVDELTGAVTTLASVPNIDPSRLFVVTNSEGAIHALNYQARTHRHRFKGLVLTGAPGRPIDLVARDQLLAQVAPLPNGDDVMKRYDACIEAFVAGKPMVPDASLPEGMKNLLLSLETPANLPFARELWLEDPADLIAQVSEPILVVIGKKDIQVDWRKDGSALETATAGNNNVRFAYPENADHVLKYEPRPREDLTAVEVGALYNAESRVIDPAALSVITEWLIEQSARAM